MKPNFVLTARATFNKQTSYARRGNQILLKIRNDREKTEVVALKYSAKVLLWKILRKAPAPKLP